MDFRNVQKTKDMHYLYLPSKWCKQNNIRGKSQVGITSNTDGSLAIYPQAIKKKPISLVLNSEGDRIESIHKLLVAAYISPANSFQILLGKYFNFAEVLNQKNLVSLEVVEINQDRISCESSLQINDPLSLLTTMIRKIKNIPPIMEKGQHSQLLDRYEEEVDRSRLLIEKSVISSLVNPASADYTGLELHFMSLIAKDLERMVDHFVSLTTLSKEQIEPITELLAELLFLLEHRCVNLDYHAALKFLNREAGLQVLCKKSAPYGLQRIIRRFSNISEVVIDWAVVKELDNLATLPEL